MTEVHKNSQYDGFYSLDKPRRDAIVMLFEDELNDEQIAENVNRTRRTLAKWKNDPKFKKGQDAYKHVVIKKDYESNAIRKLNSLLSARSEMVQLQAANSILKLSGMLSDNSTPELDKAKIRKANAEADIAEQKAKLLKNDKTGITKIVFTDDMKSDKENDTDQKRDESDGANT
ncbi:helix-turn-helix domain-containing protein [Limosilactobacillus reuteri]|uniref:helix-turn-helix domain-containing protein n=1 Tax=Limosilactobacillus reuteri TaxID=1598 RepID=UPI00107181A5|nr:helix-turn-helix domain-containing protein [Limosilactobacillus reuteri]MCH5385176.1 helix-turn-helix domain-containing protein [Limosilactobacillus reuteri]